MNKAAKTQLITKLDFKLIARNSHQRFSIKKGGIGNFAKFTGKHLCLRHFFKKVAGLKKRVSDTVVFLGILQNFQEHPFYRTHPDECF